MSQPTFHPRTYLAPDPSLPKAGIFAEVFKRPLSMDRAVIGSEASVPSIYFKFIVTCNHVHLVLFDASGSESIPRAMQFIASRVGQEYNRRKNRQGVFWQDRYHATAIESGDYLWRCIVYVDLNMVRAGVVDHPAEWKCSG
jgi:hypothetical protein